MSSTTFWTLEKANSFHAGATPGGFKTVTVTNDGSSDEEKFPSFPVKVQFNNQGVKAFINPGEAKDLELPDSSASNPLVTVDPAVEVKQNHRTSGSFIFKA